MKTGYGLSLLDVQRAAREGSMKKDDDEMVEDELRAEYDFSQLEGGVRGKYAERYKEGTNLVLLAPDVAEVFASDEEVNEALRMLMRVAKAQISQEVST